ncbi:MAG: hypothetical protein PF446_01375, partial [Oleiagrimonas sp.]|nr:hypothetical protein [Oleiagrimonas sp.]
MFKRLGWPDGGLDAMRFATQGLYKDAPAASNRPEDNVSHRNHLAVPVSYVDPSMPPSLSMSVKRLRGLLLFPLALMLSGCNMVLLHPAGDVARQQSDLMIASVIIMSLIIVPVLIAIGVIAWRYRASNKDATYEP